MHYTYTLFQIPTEKYDFTTEIVLERAKTLYVYLVYTKRNSS